MQPFSSMKLRCISCNRTVSIEGAYVCPSCGYEFKQINTIPIFLKTAEEYLSNKVLSCENRIRELEEEIISGESMSLYDAKFQRINKAIASQISIIRDLQNVLLQHCSTRSLLQNIGKVEKNGYGMTFEYLIRDWSLSAETEKEICTIKEAIFSKLPEAGKDRVLVLGAGLGRITFELLAEYKEVYAIDLSIEMPYLLERLLAEGQIGFTYYCRKNVADQGSLCTAYTISSAHIAGKLQLLNSDRLKYFVADVADLPFPNDHFDAIVSCYFTDVVPLHSMMAEIARVLKRGGVFIHFGPLDFHFPESRNFLTYEEVLAAFQQFGYEIRRFDPVLLEHVSLPNRFNKKLYDNQLFTARKGPTGRKRKLNKFSVLKMKSPVAFSLQGMLKQNGELEYRAAELTLDSGLLYEGALAVFEILRRLDGKKKLETIFSLVAAQYSLSRPVHKKIIQILRNFELQGVIEEVNPRRPA
jgi:carnosine N-methyltransferase